ncbi:hypothetical protein DICVIV_10909 [Dictyocaulus viviparus]|uniref:Uncharacterized protein n=1 Tax=Dictyocaulus viviparus TaxID=29172 RepID=A0A0D8XER6_DICVI|nr:hypothetical protein DICVIV_10909 [Dictyocaulus viviparus]
MTYKDEIKSAPYQVTPELSSLPGLRPISLPLYMTVGSFFTTPDIVFVISQSIKYVGAMALTLE